MLCTRPLYHVLAVAALAWAAPAAAQEVLSYTCEGTSITLACQGGSATGNCVTQAASDPAWDVTCRGHDQGNSHFKMICRNATEIGGTPVEITFSARDLAKKLGDGVGDATGTTCTQTR